MTCSLRLCKLIFDEQKAIYKQLKTTQNILTSKNLWRVFKFQNSFANDIVYTGILEQASLLKEKPHVVVATPGRLADLIRTNPENVRLNKLQ